ncbi:SHOCT domain-containing protein [Methylobacterium sp. JK268]
MPDAPTGLADIAARHGVSQDAARHLLDALAQGGGTAAQFNHPELGGMGQWSVGGMIMIGDMFNNGLRARVADLCADLAPLAMSRGAGAGGWWPPEFGHPASAGAQNGLRYAFFPGTRRLAIEQAGRLSVYDTGDHLIGGVSQQQGGGATVQFTSQYGAVRLEDLPRIGEPAPEAAPPPASPGLPPAPPAPVIAPAPAPVSAAPDAAGDPIALIERLAELHRKGVLTEAEFTAKKSELLARL